MISQADIIRTLVNQNCTDESIMSTALSPNCTPPKLLEKFTEAERFDLALDVSMKLGLDVSPLWKTWAMRCLKNRNFQGAREKFRHSFQRLKSSAGRGNPASCMLLCDILKELTRMAETKLPLSEEIELIKQRKKLEIGQQMSEQEDEDEKKQRQRLKISETKPMIYNECMHYLREYGTTEREIKFYVANELWDEAIKLLLDQRDRINLNKFFIQEVLLHSATVGHLDELVAAFIKLDPTIDKSSRYFKAIYSFFIAHKRYNSLYYVQDQIGDHVAAAENQVLNFYLRKPTTSYKELNHRLPSLMSASRNYRQYLNKLRDSPQEQVQQSRKSELLFTEISKAETESRLNRVDTQIEITRNFAINEVPGCINGIEVTGFKGGEHHEKQDDDKDDTSPVTLFVKSQRRRTFLSALVMIYFDPSCSAYFSARGFELAIRLIEEFELDKLQVFKTAMRIIIEDESSDILESANLLLKRLQEDYLACASKTRSKSSKSGSKRTSPNKAATKNVISARPKESQAKSSASSSSSNSSRRDSSASYSFKPPSGSQVKPGTQQAAQLLCDEVIRDSIRSCREPDYKMELSKLLSGEAKIELHIELGKLSIAQRLAFDMNRPDYVAMIMKEADKLNQDHVKDVCQHWLAKH